MSNLKGEDARSAALKRALKQWEVDGRFFGEGFHVPNEFKAYKNQQAAWQKKQKIGCKAGAPDWVIRWGFECLTVELKDTDCDEKAWSMCSDAQKEYARKCWNNGLPHIVTGRISVIEQKLVELGGLLPR